MLVEIQKKICMYINQMLKILDLMILMKILNALLICKIIFHNVVDFTNYKKKMKNYLKLMKKSQPKATKNVGKVIKLDKHKNKQLKVTNGLKDFININALQEWPQTTNIACWWDGHKFDNMPVGLPNKMVQSKLLVTGCFCSFECAMAYNLSQRDFKMSERTSLLKLLFRKLYPEYDDNIKCAPRKEVLMKFGGNLSR